MKSLMKKDMLHFLRCGGAFLVVVVTVISGMLNTVVYSEMTGDVIGIYIKNAILFSGPTVIAMISLMLIQSSFAIEKKEKTIIVLFANEFKPTDIWFSKLMVSYIIGYIAFVISFFINQIAVYVNWNVWLSFLGQEIVLMFIIFPIIGLAMIALLWLIMWVTKSFGIMIIGFVPTGMYILSLYMCIFMAEHNISVNTLTVLAVSVVAIGILFLISTIVRHIKFEYLANIHS